MSLEPDSPEPELIAIEAALGSLAPARGRLDRDRIMFLAGQASVGRRSSGRRAWIAAAAGLALIASVEAALLARRPSPEVVERVVHVREPIAPRPDPAEARDPRPVADPPGRLIGLGQTAHERMAGQVLRYGLDGLPGPASGSWGDPGSPPVPTRRRLQEEVRNDLLPGDPS